MGLANIYDNVFREFRELVDTTEELARKRARFKGQESIRGNASRSPLPGRGSNNLPRNSIIGPLISFTAKRSSALCQGRVLAQAREGAVHSGAPPARDECRPK